MFREENQEKNQHDSICFFSQNRVDLLLESQDLRECHHAPPVGAA